MESGRSFDEPEGPAVCATIELVTIGAKESRDPQNRYVLPTNRPQLKCEFEVQHRVSVLRYTHVRRRLDALRVTDGDARAGLPKAQNILPFRHQVVINIGDVAEGPLNYLRPQLSVVPDECQHEYDHAAVKCSSDSSHIIQDQL